MLNFFFSQGKIFQIAILVCPFCGFAQDKNDEEKFRRHGFSLAITHTLVPTAISSSGEEHWLSLPSWGLDYDYRFNSLWGLGLHSDLVIQNFEYEDGKGIVKERKSPGSLALVATRGLGEHLTVLAGGGIEMSKGEETLALIRIGGDYGWELPKGWEVSFSVMIDFKIEAYNAFVFGFAIGKSF